MSLLAIDSAEPTQPNPTDKLHCFQLDRRSFLKVFGGGLLVCLTDAPTWAQESGRGFGGHALPTQVSAWLHIAADGRVTVFTGKVEIGQNIRTSLAQLVAEELMTPFDSISMVMGDTDLVPWDAGTFGSQSTPQMGPRLRAMAAAARQTLIEMAARQWGVAPASLSAADGKVVNPATRQSIAYGQLTRGEKLVTNVSSSAPASPALVPANDWKVAGTSVPKVGGREFVTGEQQYPSDIRLPGMLFGKVLRPTGFNATLDSIDTSAAEKIPGVRLVRDGDFIGLVAPDAYTAEQAIAAIQAKWTVPAQPSNQDLFEYLKNNPEASRGGNGPGSGGQAAAAASAQPAETAAIHLSQQYSVQYIAHAPLEPRAAVAQWQDGKVTVWTGTQRPFGVKDELVAAFHMDPTQVRVIQPDMGSAYGGKHTGEAAVEAARLAKAAGAPVKLVWTREEEFTWAYFRPAGLMELSGAVERDGRLVAWQHDNYNSGNAGLPMPYNVSGPVTRYYASHSPLRQGSYRALASTANHFARESFMDELAHAIAMDPLAFRRKNLSEPRLLAVLDAAADKFGWAAAKSTSTRGFGIACGTEKGDYVATCAEVAIDPASKSVRVVRVVQAWESGAIVNPDGLRNQNMGAIVQGMGGALFEAILFGNGRILNPHFANYRLPRFADAPRIEIVLLDRKDIASAGAGEIGIVGIAPAIGNAIFAATGARLRNLPMVPSTTVPGLAAAPLTA